MTSPRPDAPQAPATDFQEALRVRGTDSAIAAELERRIELIEHEEYEDASRLPLTAREVVAYVGVTLGAIALGLLVVVL